MFAPRSRGWRASLGWDPAERFSRYCRVPPPAVGIFTFDERGPVLAVRPFVPTDHYWQVCFDTNKTIRATFGAADYPVPEAHVHHRTG